MSENTVDFGAYLGQVGQGKNHQQAMEAIGGNQQTAPTTPPAPAPTPDNPQPAPAPAQQPQSAAPAGEQAPPSGFDYSRFQVESDEQLVERWGATTRERDEYKQKFEQVNGEYEKVKPILEVGEYIQNPFADTLTHKVNTFMKKAGLKDDGTGSAHRFALDVLTMSDDKIQGDPVQAIALAKMLENPNLATAGIEKVYRATAIELGLDITDRESWTDDQKTILDIKSLDALKTISEKKSAYDIEDDFFVGLQRQSTTEAERVRNNEEQWSKITPAIVSEITKLGAEVEIEGIGKVSAEIALSEQEVKQVLEQIRPTLRQIAPDDSGRERVKQTILLGLRSATMEKVFAEGIKNYHNNFKANVEQEIRRQQVNGGPIVHEKPTAPTTPAASPLFEAALERMRAK